jgi:hypothetical protein
LPHCVELGSPASASMAALSRAISSIDLVNDSFHWATQRNGHWVLWRPGKGVNRFLKRAGRNIPEVNALA